MNFEKLKKLSESERMKYFDRTDGDQKLYKNIREEFLKKFKCDKIMQVVVGGYGIGEVPAIVVTQKKGNKRLFLPKFFFGLPIIRKTS